MQKWYICNKNEKMKMNRELTNETPPITPHAASPPP